MASRILCLCGGHGSSVRLYLFSFFFCCLSLVTEVGVNSCGCMDCLPATRRTGRSPLPLPSSGGHLRLDRPAAPPSTVPRPAAGDGRPRTCGAPTRPPPGARVAPFCVPCARRRGPASPPPSVPPAPHPPRHTTPTHAAGAAAGGCPPPACCWRVRVCAAAARTAGRRWRPPPPRGVAAPRRGGVAAARCPHRVAASTAAATAEVGATPSDAPALLSTLAVLARRGRPPHRRRRLRDGGHYGAAPSGAAAAPGGGALAGRHDSGGRRGWIGCRRGRRGACTDALGVSVTSKTPRSSPCCFSFLSPRAADDE